ncbi:unnamed protein product [Gongylonema pulchrum]|uniref:Grg1 protein n=1 Tax=Gongylonema pulchrum TaxID=637853 RepID=A0A183D1L9_9BILA|nr:unnamed protein product [Gongylonema pulchrum]
MKRNVLVGQAVSESGTDYIGVAKKKLSDAAESAIDMASGLYHAIVGDTRQEVKTAGEANCATDKASETRNKAGNKLHQVADDVKH